MRQEWPFRLRLLLLLLLIPMLLMAVISFRPDRNPEITVTLNDIAWLLFLTPIAPFMIQNIIIGMTVIIMSSANCAMVRAMVPRKNMNTGTPPCDSRPKSSATWPLTV